VTAINYWIERTPGSVDRILCRTPDGEEYFRAASVTLVARYAITAWAPPPEDQELLMATTRVLHDATELAPAGEGDAVHWEDKPMAELSSRFSFEEAQQFAQAYGMPLRPTLRCDIRFRLDSERKTPIKRVKERIVDYKKMDS